MRLIFVHADDGSMRRGMKANQLDELAGGEDGAGLKTLVRKYDVCYEVRSIHAMSRDKDLRVGFELDLHGAIGNGDCHMSPACPQCKSAFHALRRIAEAVLPRKAREVSCEIEPYDTALHESRSRGFRPEVVLGINILHSDGFFQPVDAFEENCLSQVCAKLRQLGVVRGN